MLGTAFESANGDNRRFQGIQVSAYYCLQLHHDHASDHHRINRHMRGCTMGSYAENFDINTFCIGHGKTFAKTNFACRYGGAAMQSHSIIWYTKFLI